MLSMVLPDGFSPSIVGLDNSREITLQEPHCVSNWGIKVSQEFHQVAPLLSPRLVEKAPSKIYTAQSVRTSMIIQEKSRDETTAALAGAMLGHLCFCMGSSAGFHAGIATAGSATFPG
jgi:hypothetical protein